MNKSIFENLGDWGCDIEGALRRLLNDKKLFVFCIRETVKELGNLSELEKAINSGDCKSAFEIAHYHKGSLGNLGITPIYLPMCELTELLRSGSVDGAIPLLDNIKSGVAELHTIINAYSEE